MLKRLERVRELQESIQHIRGWQARERIASGYESLDQLLPDAGFCRGTLVEWLGEEGSGATTLALRIACRATQGERWLVIIDRTRRFYPAGLIPWGIDFQRLILVRPTSAEDHDWAIHQSLQCPAVGAVVCWPEVIDSQSFRRFQLAAEAGGALGCFIRATSVRGKPSWSEVQLLVKRQGSPASAPIEDCESLEATSTIRPTRPTRPNRDDETHAIPPTEPADGIAATESMKFEVELLRCRGSGRGRKSIVVIPA